MAGFPLRHWARLSPLALLLWPLAILWQLLAAVRHLMYRWRWLASVRLPVPVLIVGNIHVGGVGKTPLTLSVVQALRAAGRHPGIISRGYGRRTRDVRAVQADSLAADVGDEPLLLHWRSGCPVVVGADRAAAGRFLLQQNAQVDVIVCDDGLQHYRLQRDVEVCVLDGHRGWGNGLLLPAGPLREPRSRLQRVSALVIHGDPQRLPGCPPHLPRFVMQLQPGAIYPLGEPSRTLELEQLRGRSLLAIAGIGAPERFFASLRQLGLRFQTRIFPDHHQYVADDLATDAEYILLTEKDAVKCRGFDNAKILVLPVSAMVNPDIGRWLVNHPGLKYGRQTA